MNINIFLSHLYRTVHEGVIKLSTLKISPERLWLVLQEISEELELEFDQKERELLQRLAGEDGMVILKRFENALLLLLLWTGDGWGGWNDDLKKHLRDAFKKKLRDYLGIFPNIGGEGSPQSQNFCDLTK